jgi:uncharacterized protein
MYRSVSLLIFAILMFSKSYHSLRSLNMINSLFKKPYSSAAISKSAPVAIKTVAISGSTGLLGPELVKALEKRQINVIRLSSNRFANSKDFVKWSPSTGIISNPELLEGVDAVINLAGENVGSGEGPLAFLGRWSESKKDKILSSRVNSIKTLVNLFSRMETKPKVFLTASAIGYYGYTDSNTIFDESAPEKGEGFLAEVCQQVETESMKAQKLGIRTVPMRIAVVLSKKGGILGKLLIPFSLGLGGIIGSGKQGFSWITVDDFVNAVEFVLDNPSLSGPVNLAAPNPTDNEGFTKAFGK